MTTLKKQGKKPSGLDKGMLDFILTPKKKDVSEKIYFRKLALESKKKTGINGNSVSFSTLGKVSDFGMSSVSYEGKNKGTYTEWVRPETPEEFDITRAYIDKRHD